ncbi:MAG: DUF5666 domain-containing protein [Gemmatimonadota bacterium]
MLVLLPGCADETGPTDLESEPDAEEPAGVQDLLGLQEAAVGSALRVEVELAERGGGAWMAQELEIMPSPDLDRPERIESRVVASDAAAGTLTLLVGNLEVELTAGTRFESGDGAELMRDQFFDVLALELANGGSAAVELRRAPVFPPQGPADTRFVAAEVRLDLTSDRQVLELNLDGRHLTVQSDALGTLTMLGMEVGVDLDGTSRIEERSAEQSGAVEVRGPVASVDETDGSVELGDGTIVRIVEGTRFKDGDGRLGSLADVAAALADGQAVEIEAEAVLESEGVYVAVEASGDDDGEFGGRVASVDTEVGSFTLMNGRTYLVTEETAFDEEGDLGSLGDGGRPGGRRRGDRRGPPVPFRGRPKSLPAAEARAVTDLKRPLVAGTRGRARNADLDNSP